MECAEGWGRWSFLHGVSRPGSARYCAATSGKFGTSALSKIADATSKHAAPRLEPRSPPALQRLYCTSRIVMVPLGKDCEKSFTLCDKIKGSEMVCAHPPTSSTTVAPAPTECSQCGAPITSTLPASS